MNTRTLVTVIKGACYVALAIITSLSAINGQITTQEILLSIGSGLIALRSFMDQSMATQSAADKADKALIDKKDT